MVGGALALVVKEEETFVGRGFLGRFFFLHFWKTKKRRIKNVRCFDVV